MKMLSRGLLAMAAALICAPATAEVSRDQYKINIERRPLLEALRELSEQTGLQVVVPLENDNDDPTKIAGPVQGEYTAEAALSILLAKSDLVFARVNSRTIAVTSRTSSKEGRSSIRTIRPPRTLTNLSRRQYFNEGSSTLQFMPIGSVERTGESDKHPGSSSSEIEKNNRESDPEEVVVVGTHMRGVAPVGSPLIVVSREDIESSGYGRLQDLMETLPQNFGSLGEDYNADGSVYNLGRGQAIDLRGIGEGGTLVLVNGRRQPSGGGLQGAFVDISSIASSAVERIEILSDGASAIHGSDAIAGVVNFVLRKDYDGLETDVRLASIDDSADELRFSQLLGRSWVSGNLLLGYEYSRRAALMASERPYSSYGRDFRSLGGGDYRSVAGAPATILNPTTRQPAYAIPTGQDGTALTAGDLIPGGINYANSTVGIASLPEQKSHSAFLTLTHSVNERLEMFSDVRYGRREMNLPYGGFAHNNVAIPSTHPNYVNPFPGSNSVFVSYNIENDLGISSQESTTETYAAAIGGKLRLGSDWEISLAANRGEEKTRWQWLNIGSTARMVQCLSGLSTSPCPGAPLNPFGDTENDPTTIAYIRDIQQGQADYAGNSISAVADGPVVQLPAGPARFAIGVDYRDEKLEAFRGNLAPATGVFTRADASTLGTIQRHVTATFGELLLPVFGNGKAGSAQSPSVEISLAARYEDYSDFGSTLNPKAGVNFTPFESLGFRGSWGTSFRAPRFNQISPVLNRRSVSASFSRADPLSPTGTSNVLIIEGVSPDLHEETADTWTAGFDFNHQSGFSASVTYFNIDYKDKIARPSSSDVLARQDVWAAAVMRDPTQEQIAALCADPSFSGSCPSTANVVVYRTLQNIGGLRVSGLDAILSQKFQSPIGDIRMQLNGTHLFDYSTAATSRAPFVDEVDTVGRPLALRLRGMLGWSRGGWQANTFVNFSDKYRDRGTGRSVASWTTIDATLSYRLSVGSFLEGSLLRLSGTNLLDRNAPFIDSVTGYDGANANEVGRAISIALQKQW